MKRHLIAAVSVAVSIAGCDKPPTGWSITGQTMGTTYSVKVTDPPGSVDSGAIKENVDELLRGVNGAMSNYQSDSELSRFNASAEVGWFTVSRATAEVVHEALRLGALSDGAFDVTVGPLVNLWGFGPDMRPERIPSETELSAERQRVGTKYLSVRLDPPALRKTRPDLYVDLSAIAKGYAVDLVAGYLESEAIPSYLVEIGGEIRVRGWNDNGRPWRIAVEAPISEKRAVQRIIEPNEAGVATSGDYRNYFEHNGQRFSHTIDPATGRPIDHRLASATVIHPSAMTADGLATTLMVLGPERAFQFADRHGVAAFLISKSDDGFVERYTTAFEPYLKR